MRRDAGLVRVVLLIAWTTLTLASEPATGPQRTSTVRSLGLASMREENFDREPIHWEEINNRANQLESKMVTQDFGYSPRSQHIGTRPGEVGGTINPAAEPAYYGYRLPTAFTLNESLNASGKLLIAHGLGHFLPGLPPALIAKPARWIWIRRTEPPAPPSIVSAFALSGLTAIV